MATSMSVNNLVNNIMGISSGWDNGNASTNMTMIYSPQRMMSHDEYMDFLMKQTMPRIATGETVMLSMPTPKSKLLLLCK